MGEKGDKGEKEMKRLSVLLVILFIVTGKMTAQTWTEQTSELENTTFTVIQSVERFEELLKQYADFYIYYSVLYFPKEEIETMVSNKNRIISGKKPATTTGLFLMKVTIRSDAPKPQADFLRYVGVEYAPMLLRVDPEKGGCGVLFYNDSNMQYTTGGMKTVNYPRQSRGITYIFTNYGAMFKFYKSIF